MANTTLTSLFADIANAIREKEESTGSIAAVDFPARIRALEVGGMYASIFATGVSEADTVTLTTPSGALKSGKWTSRARLPEEYQEVEYIESTGTQHIDLGFCPNLPVRIEATLTQTDSSGDNTLFSANGVNLELNYMSNQIQLGMLGSWQIDSITPPAVGTKHDLSAYFSNGEQWVKIDGQKVGESSATGTYDASKNLSLFYYDNGSSSDKRYFDGKHEEYRIYENDILVSHLIPCYIKTTGEAGFYDLAAGIFRANDGTGEFAVGADVTYEGFLFEKLGELGTYTLYANDGLKEVYEEVLVSMSTEYQIEVSYALWLYREGEECEDVTGGWGTDGWTTSDSGWAISTSVTKNADNMYIKAPSNQRYCVAAMTNPIDLTGYSTLYIEVETGSSAWALELLVTSSKDYSGENGFLYEDKSTATRAVVMADISSINQEAYIAFASGGNDSGRWAYIYNIWLE